MTRVVRTFLTLVAVVVAAAGASGQSKKRLDPVYDKNKDETTVFYSPIIWVDLLHGSGEEATAANASGAYNFPAGEVWVVVFRRFRGKTPSKPDKVSLGLRFGSSDNFRFVDNRDLTVKFDSETIDLGPMDSMERKRDLGNRSPGQPNYWETLEIEFKTELYLRMVKSKKVTFKIGSTSFDIGKDRLKPLNEIAQKDLI